MGLQPGDCTDRKVDTQALWPVLLGLLGNTVGSLLGCNSLVVRLELLGHGRKAIGGVRGAFSGGICGLTSSTSCCGQLAVR